MVFSKKIFFSGLCLFVSVVCAEHKKNIEQLITGAAQPTESFQELGQHIVAEFGECQNMHDYDALPTVLRTAAEKAGATVLHVHTHKFSPQGITGVAVLSESHISVHTWPEFGYAAVDAFTCGEHVHVEEIIKVLSEFFKPQSCKVVTLARGYTEPKKLTE